MFFFISIIRRAIDKTNGALSKILKFKFHETPSGGSRAGGRTDILVHTGRQADRQTGRQADRQTGMQSFFHFIPFIHSFTHT